MENSKVFTPIAIIQIENQPQLILTRSGEVVKRIHLEQSDRTGSWESFQYFIEHIGSRAFRVDTLCNNTYAYQFTDFSIADPESIVNVELCVFKHSSGGIFAIDASYLEQSFGDDEIPVIQDPFNPEGKCYLFDT